MALEKFAKGVGTLPGFMTRPSYSHAGATKLIRSLKMGGPLTSDFHRALGMNKEQREKYLDGLPPAVDSLERLAPALAIGVNAEYPWLAPATPSLPERVVAPVHHSFTDIPGLSKLPKLPKLIQLVGTIARSFPA